MYDKMSDLRDKVANLPLDEAYQYIIYELRENIIPALTAIRLLRQRELDQKTTTDLLSEAETDLNRTVDVIGVLMVDIFLNRLRDGSK